MVLVEVTEDRSETCFLFGLKIYQRSETVAWARWRTRSFECVDGVMISYEEMLYVLD